jgi:hypothetical protein
MFIRRIEAGASGFDIRVMKTTPTSSTHSQLARTWPLSFRATLGSSVRVAGIFLEVRAGIPGEWRKSLSVKGRDITLAMPESASDEFERLARLIEVKLEGIERLPVIPREIQDILGISSTERHRWLADGRLPSAGTRTVNLRGRARKITFHVFDPKMVEDVLDRGTVDDWREHDALAAAERRRQAAWKRRLTATSTETSRTKAADPDLSPGLKGWEKFQREGLLR